MALAFIARGLGKDNVASRWPIKFLSSMLLDDSGGCCESIVVLYAMIVALEVDIVTSQR